MEQGPLHRTPGVARHPVLSACGAVKIVRQPADRIDHPLVAVGCHRRLEAVVAAPLELVDRCLGDAVTLVVADRHAAPRTEAHAVGLAEAAREDLELRPIGRDLHHAAVLASLRLDVMPGAAVVEVALLVGVEIHDELVALQGEAGIVVEVLVEVGFAIVVEVVQAGELVAPYSVDLALDDPDSQRHLEAGGVAPPAELVEPVVDAGDDPDVAVPGGERGAAVVEEVHRREAQPRAPGVVVRGCEGIEGVSAAVLTPLAAGVERLLPAAGPPPGEGFEVCDFFLPCRPGLAAAAQGDAEAHAAGLGGQPEEDKPIFSRQLRARRGSVDRDLESSVFFERPGLLGKQDREVSLRWSHREVAGETGPALDERTFGQLQHLAAANGIAHYYASAMQVHAAVFSHIPGQGALAWFARIIPGTIEGPAGAPPGGELHLSGGGRSHALGGAAVGEEAAAPGAGDPHQLGVVDDVELPRSIEADHPGAEDVVPGVGEADRVLELALADVHGEAEAGTVVGLFPRGLGIQRRGQRD